MKIIGKAFISLVFALACPLHAMRTLEFLDGQFDREAVVRDHPVAVLDQHQVPVYLPSSIDSLTRLEIVSHPFQALNFHQTTWDHCIRKAKCKCILRFPQRLTLSFLPFAAVHVAASIKYLRLNFFIMIIIWAVLTHVLQKEWQPCR